jgi:hypothetical protein
MIREYILRNIPVTSVILGLLLHTTLLFGGERPHEPNGMKKETINFTVTVVDAKDGSALQSVVVLFKKGKNIIMQSTTNPFGKATIPDLEEGRYTIATHYLGFTDYEDSVLVDTLHRSLQIRLKEKALQLDAVVVQSHRENKASTIIDINTGRQTFEGETYHASPIAGITNLIQQNLVGASKAPTGEVHIRGQHGEFSYLVDGIPIPLGVFGGLNEIVDPKVISRVTFYTGGFPAEFGGQIAGIMDVENKVPTGSFQLDLSTFAGSYLSTNTEETGSRIGSLKALNSNGQSFSLSDHVGKIGFFLSGTRQESDRRIDQPTPELFHDHGFDYFTYGKIDYLIGEDDYVTANLNYSKTVTQVPFDPVEGYALDEQQSYNGFQTLSWFHTLNSRPDHEESLFVGGFTREGGLEYIPSVTDSVNRVVLNSDSSQSFVLHQNRSFVTSGIRAKYDHSISHYFRYATGFNYTLTQGKEDFRFINDQREGAHTITNYTGHDVGAFFQGQWHPREWTRFDFGLRYDVHNAPGIANQYQLSPRAKVSFFLDESNSVSFSYDHIFMPTNIENLGALASKLGTAGAPNVPEIDNLYEAAYNRNWDSGFNTKFAFFHKKATPGLDDQTLGSSTIRVNINIADVQVNGLELAATYTDPNSPLSGYLNASLIHAYGTGPVTGGFLPADSSSTPFDLDHDQRLSVVLGLNYQPEEWFLNVTAIYSSGLTNFNDAYTFKTGLFDFNQGGHTTPSWIVNFGAGYTFKLHGGQSIEPSLYITNIFDHFHLIKGAFFSAASFEEPRNVVLKVSYHL